MAFAPNRNGTTKDNLLGEINDFNTLINNYASKDSLRNTCTVDHWLALERHLDLIYHWVKVAKFNEKWVFLVTEEASFTNSLRNFRTL
jgi:hypothetical protein